MSEAYLLLGGNTGEVRSQFKTAIREIEGTIGKCMKFSSLYESEPWGFKHAQNFINQALLVETGLTPRELLESIQKIEDKMGRARTLEGYTGRDIDIDILLYDDLVVQSNILTIPHLLLHRRNFALQPLSEIIGNYIHPTLNKTIHVLASECPDQCWVRKIGS